MKVTVKDVQRILKKAGFYDGEIDGIIGRKSRDSIKAILGKSSYQRKRDDIRAIQTIMNKAGINVGAADGLVGPMTEAGVHQYLGKKIWRPDPDIVKKSAPASGKFPTYKNIRSLYGNPGSGGVKIIFPYKMKIAWNTSSTVSSSTCHRECKEEFEEWFEFLLSHYGHSGVDELDLNKFGGISNVRKMRGSDKWSTHAWHCSIDLSPTKNGLKRRWNKSQFSDKIYEPAFRKFRELGGHNLGETWGQDLMHFQFLSPSGRLKYSH